MPLPPRLSISLRCLALCMVLAVHGGPARAADLLASWRAAQDYDAGFTAAQAALRSGLEKLVQGDALVASRVSLTGSLSQARQDYRSGDPSGAHPSAYAQGQQYGADIVWTKPLYDAASAVARDRLHREAEQARVEYRQAEQDLMLRVATAYFDVLLSRENLELVKAQKQAVGEQLGLAKQSYELGIAPVTDRDDAQARYDSLAAGEIAAGNDLENKSAVYRQLTALDAGGVAPIELRADPGPPAGVALADWLDRAQSGNAAVRLSALGVDIAHRAVDQYRLQNSPVVALVASYGRQYEAGSISTSGGRDSTTGGSIGLQLTVPLFDAGNRGSQLRQAVASEDQQRAALEGARRDADRLTRQFYNGLRDDAERIRALGRARVSGESSLASSKVGQEIGVRTVIDVLNAEQSYYQTLYNLTAARYSYLFGRLQLAATVGALDEAELADVAAGGGGNPRSGVRPHE